MATRSPWTLLALTALLAPLLVICSPSTAGAWLRVPVEDAQLVQRSEVIVLGRILRGSVVHVPHQTRPGEGASWHHLATLAVSEVVKGSLKDKALAVVLHYGLTPVVGCLAVHPTFQIDLRGRGRACRPERVDVLDTGSSAVSFAPLVDDAGKDALWFLRRLEPARLGRAPGRGHLGVVDPEELQPAALQRYFRAYAAPDPAAAVRAAAAASPQLQARTARFLDHLEVQRVLRVADPAARARQLLPHFLRRQTWGLRAEAEEGLRGCGPVAGPLLVPAFEQGAHRARRETILGLWGHLRWSGAVARLIKLLDEHDRFWARQRLVGDWWNLDHPATEQRRERYGEVHAAVVALRRLADRRARPALERTLRRWQAIQFSNPQIVEECQAALRE